MEALDFILVCIFNGSHFLMPSDSAKWCGIFGWWSLYLGRTTLTIQCLGSHPPNNQPDDHGRWLHEVNSGCGDFEHSGKLLCPEGREFLSAKVSPEFHRLATKPRMVTWLLGRFNVKILRVRYGGMLCKMAWCFRNNEVMERISSINQDVFGSVRVPTIFKHQDVLCFCETWDYQVYLFRCLFYFFGFTINLWVFFAAHLPNSEAPPT